jgi:hypothetical protein
MKDKMRVVVKHLAVDLSDTSSSCLLDIRKERPEGSKSVICSDHSGCGNGFNGASWDYQACTELVHAIASNGETDMFPPMEFTRYLQEQYCLDRFDVSPNYSKLNNVWGIDRIDKLASRILFVNGARDGWTAGAITNAKHAILIADGAHHSEMGADIADDTSAMKDTRNRIEAIIGDFIKDVGTKSKEQQHEITYETV